jgi:hypothetical protein
MWAAAVAVVLVIGKADPELVEVVVRPVTPVDVREFGGGQVCCG